MKQVKIALIREDKVPVDRRVAMSPEQALCVQNKFPHVKIICQSSSARCFDDDAYRKLGIEVNEDISDCDILIGVKEVPENSLIADKTYLFFSHTIKKQPHNRQLLQNIIQKGIRLVDYECLTNEKGVRIIAFGRFAGIVGTYNALYAYGKKYGYYDLRRAKDSLDLQEMALEYEKIKLPPVKIALTGTGRVAKGAIEVLEAIGIPQVEPVAYLEKTFATPVYTQLKVTDYYQKKDGSPFGKQEFYQHPELFASTFLPYATVSDMLVVGAYWNNRGPILFTQHDMLDNDFAIKVVADITCDIGGAIPSTKKPSTIANPVYDYDPVTDTIIDQPFLNQQYISVMAIDNLPSELPRDASCAFGEKMVEIVLPALLGKDLDGLIRRATIADHGHLTERYAYLQDYVDEQ